MRLAKIRWHISVYIPHLADPLCEQRNWGREYSEAPRHLTSCFVCSALVDVSLSPLHLGSNSSSFCVSFSTSTSSSSSEWVTLITGGTNGTKVKIIPWTVPFSVCSLRQMGLSLKCSSGKISYLQSAQHMSTKKVPCSCRLHTPFLAAPQVRLQCSPGAVRDKEINT